MTDMDAIGFLKQLKEFNNEDNLVTPQNKHHSDAYECAFDHAIRALEERINRTGLEHYAVRYAPSGSVFIVCAADRDTALSRAKILNEKKSGLYPEYKTDESNYEILKFDKLHGDEILMFEKTDITDVPDCHNCSDRKITSALKDIMNLL